MAVRYELDGCMTCVSLDSPERRSTPVVMALTSEEFSDLPFIRPDVHDELDTLEAAESNYVEIMPTYLIGSFAIPNKAQVTLIDPDLFSFYLDGTHLVFIDDGNTASTLLDTMERSGVLTKMSASHCLFMFMRELLSDDLIFLGSLEDSMEKLEEGMLDRNENIETRDIVNYRRFTMRMSAYYQQFATMASLISENENHLMDASDARAFQRITNQADRLVARTETIKEYSMQLRELYVTQIDLKQNSIMQLFTIVTVLFAPLTLVTGWFGMNLQYLPGLDWPFMSWFLFAMGILLLIVLLFVFRRKKWI